MAQLTKQDIDNAKVTWVTIASWRGFCASAFIYKDTRPSIRVFVTEKKKILYSLPKVLNVFHAILQDHS